jgi:hypothetical protein
MKQTIASIAFLVLVASGGANAAEFTEDFDDGAVDPAEIVTSAPPGWSVNFADGKVRFEKLAGTGNGFLRMTTAFTMKGDFTASVVADRTDPAGLLELGLVCSHRAPVPGFTDIYYIGNDKVISNTFVDPIHTPLQLNDTSTPITFRIRRVGDQLFHEYDSGSGFQEYTNNTHPNLAGPVKCGLFNGQETNNTVRNEGTFDDFFITADAFTGDCGNGVLGQDEACDDDDPPWTTGEYCNASCDVVPCGDPNDSGSTTATDALFTLQAGVALAFCDLCVCDVNGSGGLSSNDALMVMNASIGLPVALACPACP